MGSFSHHTGFGTLGSTECYLVWPLEVRRKQCCTLNGVGMPNGCGRQQRKAFKCSEKRHREVNILHKTRNPSCWLGKPRGLSVYKSDEECQVRSSAVAGHCRTGLRVEMPLQGALGSLIAMGMIRQWHNRGQVVTFNHQKQGRYNYCSEQQNWNGSLGTLNRKEL